MNHPMFGIYVIDRGFVYVGKWDPVRQCLTQASNIRRWGTTKGLGQLALYGPTPNTVLDQCGNVYLNRSAVLHILETDEALWSR